MFEKKIIQTKNTLTIVNRRCAITIVAMHIKKLGKPVKVNKSTRKLLWFCDSICFC